MPAMPSGTPACPDTSRRHRLAAQLADMIPGAATIRVSLTDPAQVWPHPHTIVQDEAGRSMELGRTTSSVAARWILRVWTRPHTFRLADATLSRSDSIAAERGR
ncbi:transcriptional regulator [Streptomyces sp. NPDC007117]|uniref:transcriptional regulator n=1 Tax=Streptomyces sp. NPDC007117 TaxID=3154314 RepID=UPI0033CDCFA6